MTEAVDAEDFQSRLWGMFPTLMRGVLSLPQIDRVRWILFPEVRVSTQIGLFAQDEKDDERLPDIMRVMDLQQEQLARSLGDGHRVIHGVAGSGKTMILGYRAEHLAKAPSTKPILVLCYNEPLAVKLDAMMAPKGLGDRVQVRNFHKWCRQQLVAYGQPIPPQGPRMFDEMVDNVIRGVDRKQIPSGQYQAILIDEGHDFQPEWNPEDKDDDGIPLLRPVSCGRDGHAPVVIRLPSAREEAVKIAELLGAAHEQGHAWGDMAIICRRYADIG